MNIPIRHDNWTDQRIERLKTLWASGLSCAQVAVELGGFDHCGDRGRSAVIGKIHRLKLPKPDGKATRAPRAFADRKALANPKPRPAPTPRRNPMNSLAAKLAIADAEPGLNEQLKGEKPDGTGVKFLDLRVGQCKWPKGDPLDADFEFCGCKALPDLPYCALHTRRAMAPTQAVNRMQRALSHI